MSETDSASEAPASICRSWWTVTGAILAGLSVAAGAIGAHGIDAALGQNYAGQTREVVGVTVPAAVKHLNDFKTAAQYQMTHALGIIVVGMLLGQRCNRALSAAGWLFLLGIALFCGSLYWLSLMSHVMPDSARHSVGLIAATGGTLFILGWCCLAAGAWPRRSSSASNS